MEIKIVTDSSADISKLSDIPFEIAPLKIITTQKEYNDNGDLDVYQMVTDLKEYKGKSSTSCPNAQDWLNAFGNADIVYCITITSVLSGCHNAAMLAKRAYETEHPGRRVFVFDSMSTGPEMAIIAQKIQELVLKGEDYDKICKEVCKYSKKTGLIFMLESMKNLVNNGRVSPIIAKMAGLLGIRIVGKASDKGDLEPLHKCRGEKKALESIIAYLKEQGLKYGKVNISHCFNERAANILGNLIRVELPQAKVSIYPCGGLCSFYAEMGGLLVGFEKM